jgi:hypothetical protein
VEQGGGLLKNELGTIINLAVEKGNTSGFSAEERTCLEIKGGL